MRLLASVEPLDTREPQGLLPMKNGGGADGIQNLSQPVRTALHYWRLLFYPSQLLNE